MALVAAGVLFVVTGASSARSFSLTEAGFAAGWRSMSFTMSGTTLRCQVYMEGSFASRTLAKVVGSHVGSVEIAFATEGICTGGSATVKEETLPWNVEYNSFTGTLPNITGLKLEVIGTGFKTEVSGLRCEFLTSTREPLMMRITVSSGAMRELEPLRESTIRGSGFLCETAALSGVDSPGEIGPITITLI